ncbi:O-antigen ligase family protein [Acetobacter lambici]|uniref:O-antigen ligase family protein n=2 Tax=Acetobacter lambici TaxID=1332824 RepID=A0ABT1F228_9PROT|nr:O-antigen ligase family protein [Acetobacter lambici]MCP1257804.1 O-antigen ligase family protein [Acetobacter lambici]
MTVKNIFMFCDANLKKLAFVLCVFLPFFQLRGRAIADLIILFIGISFLLHSFFNKRYYCLLHGWFPYAMGLWGLIVVSSTLNGSAHTLMESIALVRYFVFAKALEEWLLDSRQKQQWLGLSVTLAGVWLISQCWEQYLFGVNIWGYARWKDGALTGPFFEPRAGPPLMVIMFPGLMIYPMRMVQAKEPGKKLLALGVMSFLLLTMVIIGQRMPALLVLFGFFLCALLVKTTRVPVILATLSGFVGLALLPFLSPPAYDKLVLHFVQQIGHFSQSAYGQIYMRALNMVHAHPLLGVGYNGFRAHCAETTYVYGIPQFAHLVAGQEIATGCNIHPHNIYLEIATTAGLAGLLLFVCTVLIWWKTLFLAALASKELMPSMLFITLCMLFWPLASTSSLFTERTAGWVFLMVGWGLAQARATSGTQSTGTGTGTGTGTH